MVRLENRMHRGIIFTVGLAAGLLAGGMTAMAQANVDGPVVAWNLSTYTPRGNQSMGHSDVLADSLSARTGGKFTIKIHWGGTLSPPKETIDALKIGAFEMGLVVQSFHPGKIPTTSVFDLPFLQFGNVTNAVRLQRAYYNLPEVVADAGRWNARLLTPTLLPPYELSGKGKTPVRIDDLKGLRIRAPGGMGEALKTIGVVPVNIASPEIYGSLERGILDGLVFPAYAHASYRTQELVSWYTTDMELGILAAYVAINTDAWNALPAQYRKLVDDLIEPSEDKAIIDLLAANQKIIDQFKARNLAHVQFSAADREKLVEIGGRPVWNKWVAELNTAGYPGQKLLDFVLTESAKGMKKATN
ncbi:MAG: TRAP transporter substrate-binding protein DctP [Alphaproteobacteria bacterium]